MRKLCLECPKRATHRGRCSTHFLAYERRRVVRFHRGRRAVTARLYDAAARLRTVVRQLGYVPCAMCGRRFSSAIVEIDHIQPLSSGGRDVRGNVQILCRYCHMAKTQAGL
ncbi:hypothetical protein GCM10009548_21430 [Streptomyces malaysiensis subsp. malaysiensis]